MSERVDKPSITPELIARIYAYWQLAGNGVGGSLHVLLDDGNVGSETAKACRDFALEEGDAEGAAIAEILMQMSPTQHRKLSRMNWYADSLDKVFGP